VPALTRWLVRTSFFYFLLGLAAGIWMAVEAVAGGGSLDWLFPIYIHLLVFGWLTQLICGVAYWMFPKYTLGRPHASAPLGWAMFILLNSGLVLRTVAEPLNTLRPGPTWGWLLVLSAIFQWLAALAFLINTWGRVKER